MLKLGDSLEGKYRIIGYLGQGGWSRVYLAENLKVGNKWAVKEVPLDKGTRVNLLAEPNILKQLNHRSLPRIVDIIRSGGCLYIIEDYFEGATLKELLLSRELCTEEKITGWARQLCEILIYLHNLEPSPIIYRDMKPGNVIIDSDNHVKLIDFGIAREYQPGQSSDSTFVGTQGYAAPEQYSPGRTVDERTDIYGLGATIYHAATGRNPGELPYRLPSVREVDNRLSRDLERIIHKCLETAPDNRYQRAEDLLADLKALEAGGKGSGVGGFIMTAIEQLQRATQRNVVVMEKIVGTITVAVGGTARGTGCTHTAITMALFLARRRNKVALVELNEHPVFYAIQDNSSDKEVSAGGFRNKGVDFYKHNLYGTGSVLEEVLQAGYHYVVIDLGQLMYYNDKGVLVKSPWYGEMQRASHQVLVAGAAAWQLKDLAPYIREQVSTRWRIVFTTPDKSIFKELKNELPHEVFATVFSPDPFVRCQEQDEVIARLLKPVLPGGQKSGKMPGFWS